MKKTKRIVENFVEWVSDASGEKFYSLADPVKKTIDGEEYFEATANFHTVSYVKQDTVRKTGAKIRKEWTVNA